MSDIVERLRKGGPCIEAAGCDGGGPCKVMNASSGCACAEAADEITRLRAENEKLRAAIWAISETLCEIDRQNTTLRTENEKLRAALEWYADTFCEGPAGPLCGKLDDTRCSGCKARAAMEEK